MSIITIFIAWDQQTHSKAAAHKINSPETASSSPIRDLPDGSPNVLIYQSMVKRRRLIMFRELNCLTSALLVVGD